jgi:hypothetical protein
MICETCQIEMPVRSGRFHCRRCGRLVWLGQSYVPSLAHDYAVLDQAIVKIARHLRTLLEAVAASSVDSVLFQEMRTDVDRILESLKPAETAS